MLMGEFYILSREERHKSTCDKNVLKLFPNGASETGKHPKMVCTRAQYWANVNFLVLTTYCGCVIHSANIGGRVHGNSIFFFLLCLVNLKLLNKVKTK